MEDITNRFKGYNEEQISIALQSGIIKYCIFRKRFKFYYNDINI